MYFFNVLTGRCSEDIFNACHLEQLFRHRRAHNSSSSGGRDKSNHDTSTFSGHFSWNSMRQSDFVTPVSPPYRNQRQFCINDSSSNSSGDFFGALHPKTNMTIRVSNSNKCLKSGPLSSPCLLLDRSYFQHLVLQCSFSQMIDDLGLLNWHRVQIDFLQFLYLSSFYQFTQFRQGHPFFFNFLAPTPRSSSSSASGSAAETTAETSWLFTHFYVVLKIMDKKSQ